MRTLKPLLLIISLLLVSTSHAQFFKKLKKGAESAVKKTVIRKTEEKTARETEKRFDTVFNNKGKLFKSKKAKVAESYTFSHSYTMDIIADKETTEFTYYLTNENEYLASSFTAGKDQEYLTVIDLPNSAIHNFMDLGGQKTLTSVKVDFDELNDAPANKPHYYINNTGATKKILGYNCEEYQVTGPKISGVVWVTKEADASFYKAFSKLNSKKFKGMKGMDQSWIGLVEGLALEMVMVDISKKKHKTIKMVCTGLKEQALKIETANYQKL